MGEGENGRGITVDTDGANADRTVPNEPAAGSNRKPSQLNHVGRRNAGVVFVPGDEVVGADQSTEVPIARVVHEYVERMIEPLGLDRWTIFVEVRPGSDEGETASCEALPEYKVASLRFDPERLRTGDDLSEFVAHELAHIPTWPLFQLAEDYANALADAAPEYLREALREKFIKETTIVGEDVTTQVGFTFIRLLRRLWDAEARLAEAEKSIKAYRKQLKVQKES